MHPKQLGAEVHSFEPQPEVFALLKANVEGNGLSHVTPWNLAVSSAPGVAHFSGSSAYGHISDDASAPEVRVVTIDGFVKEQALQRVDLIKIDVEGFEPQVLKGARVTIEKFNPIIYMEFNSWCLMMHGNTNPFDFAKSLFADFASVHVVDNSDKGFSSRLSPDHVLHDNIVRSGSVNDLILLKRPKPLHATSRELEQLRVHVETISGELRDALKREELMQKELDSARATCAKLEQEAKAHLNSSSWRITAPMRQIKGAFRK
ncbi:FkbM family methyltransferase [Phyllobacterium sp. P5_D12]